MMINELDLVALTIDLPEHRLKAGDIGTVVYVHNDGEGYELEFMTLDGETIAVVTVLVAQVRPIGHGEIANARVIEAAV